MTSRRIPLVGARKTLLEAGKQYSLCAKHLHGPHASRRTLSVKATQLIGLGVASDWTRRAAVLEDVSFIGSRMHASSRTLGFVDLLRFTFAWSGVNAIFARDELLGLIGTPLKHELPKFRVLYDAAQIPVATVTGRLALAHGALGTVVRTSLPGIAPERWRPPSMPSSLGTFRQEHSRPSPQKQSQRLSPQAC
jgi:hypothetical protein